VRAAVVIFFVSTSAWPVVLAVVEVRPAVAFLGSGGR